MAKVTIDTTWLTGIEDMPISARIQFYGSLMALVLDGVEVTPKEKHVAFAWKCVMPVIRKSLAISRVRREARLSATKGDDKCSNFCNEQNADTCNEFCCEQNANKIESSGSVSDVISDGRSQSNVVMNVKNGKFKEMVCTQTEPQDSSKNGEKPVGAKPNISLSNNNINNNLSCNNKEEKEIHKESEESKKQPKMKYAEHVSMTEKEFEALMDKFGKEQTIWMVNKLNSYKGSKNKRYASDYLAILNWVVGEYEKQNKNTNGKVNSRIHPGSAGQVAADYGNSTI